MAAETIKEFLVALGFKVDESQFRSFNSGIAKATGTVLQLGAVAATTGLAVEAMVERVAKQFEELWYAAQRGNTTADSLLRVGYAAKQIGLDAGEGIDLVQGLFRAMRDQPGTESIIRGLGVRTRDANGALRDTKDLLNDLGPILLAMPRFQALMYGDALGFNREALNQALNNWDTFVKAQDVAAQRMRDYGVDADETAKKSVDFMRKVNQLEGSFGTLAARIATDLMPQASHLLDEVQQLTDWFGKWNDAEKGIPGEILAIASAVGGLEAALALFGKNSIVRALVGGSLFRFLGPVYAFGKALGIGQTANTGETDLPAYEVERERQRSGNAGTVGLAGPRAAGSLGNRSNNFGNISPGGIEAQYATPLEGVIASSNLLLSYSRKGYDTIQAIYTRWAEAARTDGGQRVGNVSRFSGFAPNEHLDLNNPDVRARVLGAIFRQEGTANAGSSDLIRQAVSGGTTINQATTINVSGAGDPNAVGRRVLAEQARINGDLARNLPGQVR